MTAEIQTMESHMRGLEMVANTAPLLGLLGTVMGMITVFATLSEAGGRVDPAILASGIWEALVTTVGGLVVAIPSIAAYYILDGQIEKVRVRMRVVAVQILALEDVFMRNEEEQRRREAIEERSAMQKHEETISKLKEEQKHTLSRIHEEQERLKQEQEQLKEKKAQLLDEVRSAPQSSGTLKLLSPSYRG